MLTCIAMVGKIIYLTNTRPDLSFAVGLVSRFMHNPKEDHMQATKHIFRYLRHTTHYGIFYRCNAPITLSAFTDADWATCPTPRRSVGAYLVTLGDNPISWHSKRQATASKSSTESEYLALSSGAQEAVYIRRLLLELQLLPDCEVFLQCTNDNIVSALPSSQTTIHYDNDGAIKLARNPVFHARTKHIEVHHHFVRERVLEGEINIQYIPTDLQPADVLTKALSRPLFEKHRTALGVVDLSLFSPKSALRPLPS